MMDVKDYKGNSVSLLNLDDELPRLSKLTSLSVTHPPPSSFSSSSSTSAATSSSTTLPRRSPSSQHHLHRHPAPNRCDSSSSSSTSSLSASSTGPGSASISPDSNPPSLSRSDSTDSDNTQFPSPVTPFAHGLDDLRAIRKTLPRKFSSSLEGLPSLSSLREQAKLPPPPPCSMDFSNPQQIPTDFAFTSPGTFLDPLAGAAPLAVGPTAAGIEQPIAAHPPPPSPAVAAPPHVTNPAPTAPAVFPTPISTPKASAKKNQYPCPLAKAYSCNEFFTTSGHAARHSKKHTGKKDAICPECGKGFTRKDNMEQHRRTHASGRNKSNSAASESSSSAKPAPNKDSDETKARQKARQQQRKSRPSSISTVMPQHISPPMPAMPQQLPLTTMSILPPQGEMLDPALREQALASSYYSPSADLNMGFGFPPPMSSGQMSGQMPGFPAPPAPMSRMANSRAPGGDSPQALSPTAVNLVSPSAAPLSSGMDKLDILAEASSRRSSE